MVPPAVLPGASSWFSDPLAPTAALPLMRAPWSSGGSLWFRVPETPGSAQTSLIPKQSLLLLNGQIHYPFSVEKPVLCRLS